MTGAFGNVGESTLQELLSRWFEVISFDVPTQQNKRIYEKLKNKEYLEVIWGDIRDRELVTRIAGDGLDSIIHLAAIIPPATDLNPELSYEVNVGGTRNLLDGAAQADAAPKFIYASSIATYGHCDGSGPPKSVSDPQVATDNYTAHKIECEKMVKESGLPWTILRFGVVTPLRLDTTIDPIMFEIPLDQRIEFVHAKDIGLALANAVKAPTEGKIFLLGGGEDCRMHYKDLVRGVLEAMGIGMLPDSAFKHAKCKEDYYHTDWMDTVEAQEILQFQTRSFEDFLEEYRGLLGARRYLVRLLKPLIRRRMLSRSPYYKD